MPKIRRIYLEDEWTYVWRAHRQGHTNKYISRGFVRPQLGYVTNSGFFVSSNPLPPNFQSTFVYLLLSLLIQAFKDLIFALSTRG